MNMEGLIVTPGFIDTHSHSDIKILEEPLLEPKICQGITTELLGQDGIAMAPLPIEHIESWRKNISGLDGESDLIDWTYENSDTYLKSISRKGTCSNIAYLVPHGNVRLEAMGMSGEKASKEQVEKMKGILEREMKCGAVGFSTGLIYIPCTYAETSEVKELCEVVKKYDGVFVVHQRSEGDEILESLDEVIDIAKDTKVKLHISHFKLCGKEKESQMESVLKKLDDAKKEGVQISFDQYPYTAGSTTLSVLLPPWVHIGGSDKMLDRLKDPNIIKQIEVDVKNGIKGWDNFIDFAGYEGIYITNVNSEKNKEYIGKNILQISEIKGIEPLQVVIDIIREEENKVSMIDYFGLESHIKTFIQRPEQNFCTDGILHGQMHPRTYGAFPKAIRKYVKEEKLISIEEAIYKMTAKPAEVFGLNDRGKLEVGMAADIVAIDFEQIEDVSTYLNPKQLPKGIEMVMVNGEIVINGSDKNITLSGKVLRK